MPFHHHTDTVSMYSVTTQWMMAEQVKPDTFDPPMLHTEMKHQS